MIKKTCTKCQAEKEITEFHKSKDGKFGVRAICKVCIRQMDRDYYAKHREEISPKKNEYQKEYYRNNPEKVKKYQMERYLKTRVLKGRPKADPEARKQYSIRWRQENKERLSVLEKKWKLENSDKLREQGRARREIPENKIKANLRNRIWCALKGVCYSEKSRELIGLPLSEYMEYLECQFDENMNWENYGSYWSVDHVIPLSKFDLNSHDKRVLAFNFRNTRPLNNYDNIKKSDKSISALWDILGIDKAKNLLIQGV